MRSGRTRKRAGLEIDFRGRLATRFRNTWTMGGIGSGRSGGRPTVEGAVNLDLGRLRRSGAVQPGNVVRFSLDWTWGSVARPFARVTLEIEATDEAGELRVVSLIRYDPIGHPYEAKTDQVIRLVTTPAPFGGRRWWMLCPFSGRRVLKVHCPTGRDHFASRAYYRLGYACQRETRRDRDFRRARKARNRVGGSDNLALRLPGKPKWMRWPTYWRLAAQANQAHESVIAGSMALLQRMGRKIGQEGA